MNAHDAAFYIGVGLAVYSEFGVGAAGVSVMSVAVLVGAIVATGDSE